MGWCLVLDFGCVGLEFSLALTATELWAVFFELLFLGDDTLHKLESITDP